MEGENGSISTVRVGYSVISGCRWAWMEMREVGEEGCSRMWVMRWMMMVEE